MGMFWAAVAGAYVDFPRPLHILFCCLVGMAAGAAWAAIAALLKVKRGVNEVIATIMLNTIATGISAYLLANYFQDESGSLNIATKEIPRSGRVPSLNGILESITGSVPEGNLQGFLVVALLVGLLFWVIVFRTRFGFELRATGLNPWAAQASGVDSKGMIIRAMVLSGAMAGLVGMAPLLGFFNRYTLDFTTGLGFAGIGVALLGRNHPVGMAAAALLFGFLSTSSQILDLEDIPKEIVDIMQGVILLSVVVAWEVVRRIVAAGEVRAAAEHDERHDTPAGAVVA
jgi:simple sugar transport system permease protein